MTLTQSEASGKEINNVCQQARYCDKTPLSTKQLHCVEVCAPFLSDRVHLSSLQFKELDPSQRGRSVVEGKRDLRRKVSPFCSTDEGREGHGHAEDWYGVP